MRLTALRIAKKNLVEGYHNKSIFYSIFFPAIFLLIAMQLDASNLSTLVGLAFVFGSLDDALLSLSRERDSRTLAKLFLSPVSRWSITGGRILSSLLLGALKATLVAAILYFDNYFIGPNSYIHLALYYVPSSLIILLTVLIGLTCSVLFRDFRLTVLLASSVIFLFVIPSSFQPILQDNSNIINQYNPFWLCYQMFDKLVNIETIYSLEQYFLLISAWIIGLFLIANGVMRRKIA